MNALIHSWKKWIATGLDEDSIAFDWTARAVKSSHSSPTTETTEARLIAKADGVWAAETGLRALEILSTEMGMPIAVQSSLPNGSKVIRGQDLCTWIGTPESIVTFERTFINLASYFSGIATETARYVEKVRASGVQPAPRITATRKTLPGYRDLAIESTLIGGAHPHRFNLSGGLLLKENHIESAGSVRAAIEGARKVIPHLLKVEIEVKNVSEMNEALGAGAEVIMLDNFSPEDIRAALKQKPETGVTIEVSGGITLMNLDHFLIPGVDIISVGSLTHSVKALDLSLLVSSLAPKL